MHVQMVVDDNEKDPPPPPPLPSWPIKDLQRDIFEGSPSKPQPASTAASGDFCY